MELNIGDYIRTLEYIRKIRKIKDNYVYCDIGVFCFNEIIKSSPNIIDLIEVGDVVTIKTKYCDGDIYKVIDKGKSVVGLDCFQDGIMNVDNDDIKSILTKEQFESMEYKIGE